MICRFIDALSGKVEFNIGGPNFMLSLTPGDVFMDINGRSWGIIRREFVCERQLQPGAAVVDLSAAPQVDVNTNYFVAPVEKFDQYIQALQNGIRMDGGAPIARS